MPGAAAANDMQDPQTMPQTGPPVSRGAPSRENVTAPRKRTLHRRMRIALHRAARSLHLDTGRSVNAKIGTDAPSMAAFQIRETDG